MALSNKSFPARRQAAFALFGLLLCGGCGDTDAALGDAIGQARAAVVHGSDDRREYYDTVEQSMRHLFEAHAVVLMNKRRVESVLQARWERIPTWAELDRLCPDEPFANQPTAAFCSGVLAGDGLVLTSEHCLYGTQIDDIRVVFGYYYIDAERLAVDEGDVHEVSSIVRRSSDDGGVDGVDFAWLRLAERTRSSQTSVPVFTQRAPLVTGTRIFTVNAGGGIPLKLDAGGSVLDARPGLEDFFVADTDTFRGSSGGGAFTSTGALLGTLARGSADFALTESGCKTVIRNVGATAQEQFTYAHRAVEGLCHAEPWHSLCEDDCEQPCRDRSLNHTLASTSSCQYAPGFSQWGNQSWLFLVMLRCLTAARNIRQPYWRVRPS